MTPPKSEEGLGLGRTMVKSRFGGKKNKNRSTLHQTGMNDGASWMNKTSITEQNDLDELMQVACLAGTEFTAGMCIKRLLCA